MNTPTLETKRLILRKFTENDIEALFLILKDKEVNTSKIQNAANKMGCSPLLDENDYFLPILNSSLDIVAKNCLHPMRSESWITKSVLSLSVDLIQSWTISSYHSIIRCLTRQQMVRESLMFIR